MAIRFVNIRSGEELTVENGTSSEPQIAALWSSSDHSPNITQGQDFGWRMAPEVVIEMERLMGDPIETERIAARLRKPVEDMKEIDFLEWISRNTKLEDAPAATMDDYEDTYQRQVRKLRGENVDEPRESVSELRKRLAEAEEAEAEEAAAKKLAKKNKSEE